MLIFRKSNEARHFCIICSKHICNQCIRNMPIDDQNKESINLCRRCNNVLHDKLVELKWKTSLTSNKLLTSLYEEIKNNQNAIESHFPQFKGIVLSLISLFGKDSDDILSKDIDDGKPFDIPNSAITDLVKSAIKLHPQTSFRKLETSINNLSSYKTNSNSYLRLISIIKSHFTSYLKSKKPDFQLLEKQFNAILSHRKIKRILEENRWTNRLEQKQKKNSIVPISSSPTTVLESTSPRYLFNDKNKSKEVEITPEESNKKNEKKEEKFKIHRVWGKQV